MSTMRQLRVGVLVPEDMIQVLRRGESKYENAPIAWIPMDNLHLTLDVWGQIDDTVLPEKVDELIEAVSCHEPFYLVFDRWTIGPDIEHPKMVWLTAQEVSQNLANLKTDILRVMAPMTENFRAYSGHITLGRIKQKAWRELKEKPEIERETSLVVPIDTVTIFESATIDGKKKFIPLAMCPLGD